MAVKQFHQLAIAFGFIILIPIATQWSVRIAYPYEDAWRLRHNYQKKHNFKPTIEWENTEEGKRVQAQNKQEALIAGYVGSVVGIAAIIVGALLPLPGIGAGLLVAGLLTIPSKTIVISFWSKDYYNHRVAYCALFWLALLLLSFFAYRSSRRLEA